MQGSELAAAHAWSRKGNDAHTMKFIASSRGDGWSIGASGSIHTMLQGREAANGVGSAWNDRRG